MYYENYIIIISRSVNIHLNININEKMHYEYKDALNYNK